MKGKVDLDIPVSYDEDIAHTKDIFNKCILLAYVNEKINLELKGIQSFGDSAVIYRLTVHCYPEHMQTSMRRVNDLIYTVFKEENIDIPYQQIVIHQKKEVTIHFFLKLS